MNRKSGGQGMTDAERFRRLAQQYHQLASGTADPSERDQYLKLARTWDNFARKAEQPPNQTRRVSRNVRSIRTD
jgi:hypothetical protein